MSDGLPYDINDLFNEVPVSWHVAIDTVSAENWLMLHIIPISFHYCSQILIILRSGLNATMAYMPTLNVYKFQTDVYIHKLHCLNAVPFTTLFKKGIPPSNENISIYHALQTRND